MKIEDYEFADVDINIDIHHSDDISLAFKNVTAEIFMQKHDVIQLAKHFKLTSDDLNTD